MAKCDRRTTASSFLTGCGGGGKGTPRVWPVFSDPALRRRIIGALFCGVSSCRRSSRHGAFFSSPPPPSAPAPSPSETRHSRCSDRLSELFKADEAEWEERKKADALATLKRAVEGLRHAGDGEWERSRKAATEVRRLAKDDPAARVTLALLGAIPALVRALGSSDESLRIASLYALLNLGIGNDANKGAIVEAGALDRMLNLVESGLPEGCSPAETEAVVANLFALSALDSNKPIIGSSAAVPFLLDAFRNSASISNFPSPLRHDALRALFNLSISSCNVPQLTTAGILPTLLAALGDDMHMNELALSALSNVVSTTAGRRAISRIARNAFPVLLEVLSWCDSPGCQEKAAYVLMVIAHRPYSSTDRANMVEAGAVSVLLELTLLGTAIAQKRASATLECLRVDTTKQVSEGFPAGGGGGGRETTGGTRLTKGGFTYEETMSEERKAVRQLVQLSLQTNMRRIATRANLPLPLELVPSEGSLRTIAASTNSASSRSLPL